MVSVLTKAIYTIFSQTQRWHWESRKKHKGSGDQSEFLLFGFPKQKTRRGENGLRSDWQIKWSYIFKDFSFLFFFLYFLFYMHVYKDFQEPIGLFVSGSFHSFYVCLWSQYIRSLTSLDHASCSGRKEDTDTDVGFLRTTNQRRLTSGCLTQLSSGKRAIQLNSHGLLNYFYK